MSNDFFNASGTPAQGSQVVTPNMRAEFAAIAAGFDKMPALTGNGYKIVYINASGSAMVATGGDGLLKISTTGIPTIAIAGTDYLVDIAATIHAATNKATPVDADEVGIWDSVSGLLRKVTWANLKATLKVYFDTLYASLSNPINTEQSLTGYYYPAAGSAFQDMYRSGWLPSWFNQQWGGAQWGTLPDGSFGSVATGNIEDNAAAQISSAASVYYLTQGFIVSENLTNPVVWVKLYKVGNPPAALTLSFRANSGGSPTGADLISGTIGGRLVTSKTDGEWYPIQFTGTINANTQYHLLGTMGTTDASNYFVWKYTSAKKYPHGYYNAGTSAPVWTPTTTIALCFLIQNLSANSLIQSGGMFDYKLCFNPGTPVNQSRSVAQPLVNFYDGKTCSVLYRGTFAVSTNVWDFTYGLDHDRITLTINASGYPVLTIYEADRTVATVTGTGSVASGNHDVGIRVRTVGDGADYATLYVDGVSVGTPLTAQTFTMDVNFAKLGNCRLGDGFGLAPTWTQDMQMTSLPSAQGWTFTGGGTESTYFSIQNNKLYQSFAGFASTDSRYYAKTGMSLVSATGWAVAFKVRVPYSPNTGDQSVVFQVTDNTNSFRINIAEYFLTTDAGGAVQFTYQGDFKSQENVFVLQAKGSDYYLFCNGKLIVDGTGKAAGSGGSAAVYFGDGSSAASGNADAIWSYVKYYQGGMLLPTAGSNTCSEFAHWSGDKSALFPSLWNSGTPVSVKQLCGVPRNYQFEQVVQREVRRGVTTNPSTSSPSAVLLPDMELYLIGSDLDAQMYSSLNNATSGNNSSCGLRVDGVIITPSNATTPAMLYATAPTANGVMVISPSVTQTFKTGLHKVEGLYGSPASTSVTAISYARNLTVEARS